MGRELTAPDWPALTDEEVGEVLGGWVPGGWVPGGWVPGWLPGGQPVVTWRSPRPMSAAALVRQGTVTVFLKRHHVRVRTPAQLAAEHAFAAHLRRRGQPVPLVLHRANGQSVLRRGDYCYEVHQLAEGADLYRDAVSWSPYASPGHAHAAGQALAALHLAAADFPAPARPFAVLMNSCRLLAAADPRAEADRLIGERPDLAAYLAGRHWPDDFTAILAPLIRRAAPRVRSLPGQWGHGDWHPSNLSWTSAGPSAQVAGIFDLGLANRTSAVHDLAIALERSVVDWLGTADADAAAAAALLDGYQEVRPLTGAEAAALPVVLPVVHLEYALSEADYFTGVTRCAADAGLAYDYLIGHARWFGQPQGAALLAFLGEHLRRSLAVGGPVGRSLAVGGPVGRAVRVVAVRLGGPLPAGRVTGPRRVVDLQGGVGDAVLAGQERLQIGADRVAILARRDQDMGGGGGQARGDLPDMQVMDLGDVTAGRHRAADRRRIQPRGCGLKEDPAGLLDQPGPGVQHQHHHDERGDRVRPGEPGQHDDQARHRGGGERVEVGEDVLERAGEVEARLADVVRAVVAVARAGPGDQQGRGEVDGYPRQRDAENRPAAGRRRCHQPAHGRIAKPGREQDQGEAISLRRHDLGAPQPVGVAAGRRPGGQPRGDQHQRDGRGVGQHVRGVRDQRQGVRGQAGHDLAGHERQDQDKRSRQPPGARPGNAGRRAVAMPVSSRHHLTISSLLKDR
jgi:Ser/Thr protein kinase RdoA (MazF antagonist)